jgi:hypothetical protein
LKTPPYLRIVGPSLALSALALLLLASVHPRPVKASAFPRLICGTDAFAFSGTAEALAGVHTNGPNIVSEVEIIDIDFPLNGITSAYGHVVAGQPEDVGDAAGNTLRELGDFVPLRVLQTIPPGSNSFSATCCNEQMVQAPDGKFYHAHYSDSIQQLGLQSGQSVVLNTFPQSDVVGMATDGVSIWITNWSSQQVGKWDPATNIFTPVFTTPSSAGGLAWDVANGVLWVGMEGGSVIPYDATGKQLGNGFQPFGNIGGDTVDGLAFVPQ